MLTELTIIYPHKSNRNKLIELINKQKKYFLTFTDCKEFNIHQDMHSEKIFIISKWPSKDAINDSLNIKAYQKQLTQMVNLQKFPAEVYRLEDID